jgi:hypothetical protein
MKIRFRYILPVIFLSFSYGINAQHLKFQVGLELGKYIRNWNYVKQVPVEVVAVGIHEGNVKLYPRISIGYGDFLMKKNNYEAQISGYYFKPGMDFYFGKKKSIINGVLSSNLIIGYYKYSNSVIINNPVWGDYVVKEKSIKEAFNGIEFNIGFAAKLTPKMELKMLWGLRGKMAITNFSENAKGIIPGYGKSYGNYSASPSASIIFSYRIN